MRIGVLSRQEWTGRRRWAFGGVGALLVLLLPVWASSYIQSVFIFIAIYSLVVVGMVLLTGFAGQPSLGQSAFFGIGAYTSALLALKSAVPPLLGLVFGAVLTGAIAYIIGKPILKLRGFSLAVATAALAMIFDALVSRLAFTGGHDGFSGVPHLSIGALVIDGERHYYYLMLIVLTVCFLAGHNLVKSRVGRGMRAIDQLNGGSELAAQSLGVDPVKLKTRAFVIAAVYAAIAGGIYAHYMGQIQPQPFQIWWSLVFVAMVVIGGSGSLWGGIIGAVVWVGFKEVISHALGGMAAFGWQSVAFALAFALFLVYCPGGLVQLGSRVLKWSGGEQWGGSRVPSGR